MTTEIKTALERLNFIATESNRHDFSDSVSLQILTKALQDELAAEQTKTHREILTEAFERCGATVSEGPIMEEYNLATIRIIIPGHSNSLMGFGLNGKLEKVG